MLFLWPHEKIFDFQLAIGNRQSQIGCRNGTLEGVMCGSPAVIVGECGKGRVVCISPHLEKTPGFEYYIYRAVRWAAGEHTGTAFFHYGKQRLVRC